MMVDVTRYLTLKQATDGGFPLIRSGDLLLWRRRGLISIAGRGRHSHAALYATLRGVPYVLEVREFFGGRAVTLESQVAAAPGRIDVFRPTPHQSSEYDRFAAVNYMLKLPGCRYGWTNVLTAALLHLPLVRLLTTPDFDDDATTGQPPFCSQAVASAFRAGGVDPVPRLADRFVEPSDLARSTFFEYVGTLNP